MVKQRIMILGFIFVVCLAVADAYAGPVVCDGKVGHDTDKASGKLLVAVGFVYSAMGFMEAGEQKKVENLRELIKPVIQAQEAMKLFRDFAKADLPPELKNLDELIRKTDYKGLYEKLKAKELVVPATIWSEVSGKARKEGVKGLVDV